ncbi:DUF2442 domain-containing protein [Chitinophaga sp. SYP-B3965]|uniref:DUF2442 domain-containing protein n=1 Tax=Chitinophaga sp. SYP-B3965 TaxID=2663120 RepID=UPI0015673F72|nr:DUF2442 domain-containing protein [Chitinophaga sp. SYP-B3965]
MNPRVSTVQFKSPYKLILTFTNNEVKEFDFSSYLDYPVYKALKDETFSSKARVFNGTVIWDENVDFDPDTLYLESEPLFPA